MAGRGRGRETVEQHVEDGDDDEDDEGESESGDEMVCYLEDPPSKEEARLLTRRMFPSKVGGKPAWLVPKDLPASSELTCQKCSRPLRFLLQVYASREQDKSAAFHRVLHVFVCTNCQPNQVRIFRAQLPRRNAFYSHDPPDAKRIARELRQSGDRDRELCELCCLSCGLPRESTGGDHCTECQRLERIGEAPAMFQERELSTVEAELLDEEEDEAEATGTSQRSDVEEVFTPAAAKALGRDRDIVADAEAVIASAKAKGASKEVLDKLAAYKAKVEDNTENALDVSEQAAFEQVAKERGEYDAVFSKFNRYANANPGHALRYVYGGKPLWFAGPNQLQKPPPCGNCGAARIFEFQVQPQLIALLSGSRLAERLDYGIVCCYVCGDNCDRREGSSPYIEEFAHVQPEPYDAWMPKG